MTHSGFQHGSSSGRRFYQKSAVQSVQVGLLFVIFYQASLSMDHYNRHNNGTSQHLPPPGSNLKTLIKSTNRPKGNQTENSDWISSKESTTRQFTTKRTPKATTTMKLTKSNSSSVSKWPLWKQPSEYKVSRKDMQMDPEFIENPNHGYRLLTNSDTQYQIWNDIDKSDVGNSFVYNYAETPQCQANVDACTIQFPLRMLIDDTKVPEKGIISSTIMPHCISTNHCAVTVLGTKWRERNDHGVVKRYRKFNQDRGLIIHNNGYFSPSSTDQTFLVLADGHGPLGHLTAEYTILHLPTLLWRYIYHDNLSIDNAIIKAFLETDQGFVTEIQNSGSTAVLAWQYSKDRVVLASAGDSHAYLVAYNYTTKQVHEVMSAVRHYPTNPVEHARILANGGHVNSAYVTVPKKDGTTYEVAMSRSIGETTGKTSKVLTAEPSIVHVDLHKYQNQSDVSLFLFVCSDGVLDFMDKEYAFRKIGKALYGIIDDEQQQQKSAQERITLGVQSVLDSAAKYWAEQSKRRDDMTLLVSKVSL